MALAQPLGFDALRPEHRQILLPSWRSNKEADSITDSTWKSSILPLGFPSFLDSKLAWSASEGIQLHLEHTYHLSLEDKAEIDNALHLFKSLNRLPLQRINFDFLFSSGYRWRLGQFQEFSSAESPAYASEIGFRTAQRERILHNQRSRVRQIFSRRQPGHISWNTKLRRRNTSSSR